ncbi:extracellular solute-binding protein [Paenibacillus sp. CC-CFT747]|nr:extracellular solute-binding protein [Paenibacillus sp. CC-CFT747]
MPAPSHFANLGFSVILDAFRRDHPLVDIKMLTLPAPGYWDSLRISREMGLQPDVILVTDTQYSELANPDAYEDLDSLCPVESSDLYPKVLGAFRDGERIKALPVTFSTVFLAYNPSLFAANGIPVPNVQWTLDEFKQAALSLTRDTNGDGILDRYGFSLSSHMSRWPVFALQNGFKPDGRESNRETILRTFTFFHDFLYHSRCAVFQPGSPNRLTSNPFVKGKSGMALTTTFEMASWQELNFKPAVGPLPLGDVDATLLLANALMIPSDSSEPGLAEALLRTAIRPDVQDRICRSTPFLSVLRSINEEARSHAFLRNLNILEPAMENNLFLNELIGDPDAWQGIQEQIELFMHGLESAEDIANLWKREGASAKAL